jgi:hypothetical protein
MDSYDFPQFFYIEIEDVMKKFKNLLLAVPPLLKIEY